MTSMFHARSPGQKLGLDVDYMAELASQRKLQRFPCAEKAAETAASMRHRHAQLCLDCRRKILPIMHVTGGIAEP